MKACRFVAPLRSKANICFCQAFLKAKDNKHIVGAGMQQALDYAETLDVPFAYSSNGDAFLEHDRTRSKRHHHARNFA